VALAFSKHFSCSAISAMPVVPLAQAQPLLFHHALQVEEGMLVAFGVCDTLDEMKLMYQVRSPLGVLRKGEKELIATAL